MIIGHLHSGYVLAKHLSNKLGSTETQGQVLHCASLDSLSDFLTDCYI